MDVENKVFEQEKSTMGYNDKISVNKMENLDDVKNFQLKTTNNDDNKNEQEPVIVGEDRKLIWTLMTCIVKKLRILKNYENGNILWWTEGWWWYFHQQHWILPTDGLLWTLKHHLIGSASLSVAHNIIFNVRNIIYQFNVLKAHLLNDKPLVCSLLGHFTFLELCNHVTNF